MPGQESVSDVTRRLVEIGLGEDEARVYVALRRLGPAKARDVAAAVDLPRPKSYRLLEHLTRRGFVAATLARPTRFQAIEPERLFRELRSEQDSRRDELGRAERDLLPALAALGATHSQNGEVATFRVVQGRSELTRVSARLLREATATVDLFDTPLRPGAALVPGNVWAAMPGAILARGRSALRGRLLIEAELAALAPVVELEAMGAELRVAPCSGHARFLVVDGRELLLDLSAGIERRAEHAAALWSDASALVGTFASLFEATWRAAPTRAPGAILQPVAVEQNGNLEQT